MNRSDSPKKQPKPFGVNGQRVAILPTTPAGDNSASYEQGFPPITMILKSAGGLPPKGQDMNQILYELSALGRWSSTGALNTFDSEFASEISGYPSGAMLISDDGERIFINTTEGNLSDPNSNGTGWKDILSYLGLGMRGTAVFTSTATWTCPAGVTTVYIDACGGGGGGAYGTLNATGGGGGGGAQAVRRSAISVSPGQTYIITVGLGGVAGVVGSVNGGNGGTTSFGSLISLAGGIGGKNNGTGSAPGGVGGTYGISGNYTSSLSFGGPGGQCIFGSSGPAGNGIQVGQGGGGYGAGGGGGAGGQAGGGGANGWMQIWW